MDSLRSSIQHSDVVEGEEGGAFLKDTSTVLRNMGGVDKNFLGKEVMEFCGELTAREGNQGQIEMLEKSYSTFVDNIRGLEEKEREEREREEEDKLWWGDEKEDERGNAEETVQKGMDLNQPIHLDLGVVGATTEGSQEKERNQEKHQEQEKDNPEREARCLAALETLLFKGAITIDVLQELQNAMGTSKTKSDLVRMAKVMKEIYRAVDDFKDDEKVARSAVSLLGAIAANVPHCLPVIVSTGGIPKIMKVMRIHSTSIDVHNLSIFVMLAITQDEEGRRGLIKERAAEHVTRAMNKFPDARHIILNGALTLCNLAFGEEENKKRIGKIGGIDAVLMGMTVHDEDPDVQIRCCLALRNLTYGSRANQWIAGNACAMECIAKCMTQFPDLLQLQHHALAALLHIISDEVSNRQRAENGDFIPLVIRAMKLDMQNREAIENGLTVLRDLSIGNRENQLVTGDEGGIQLIIDCMKNFRAVDEIINVACSALRYLFFARENRETILVHRHLAFLVHILRDIAEKPKMAENAMLALGNSCFDLHESKKAIGRYGGIAAVVDVMSNNLEAEDLQEYGCRALRNLADCDELNIRLLGESGAVDAAVYAIMGYRDNENIQEQAFAMLFNMAFSEQNLLLMKDVDVQRIVEHAMAHHTQNANIKLQASGLLHRLKPFDIDDPETTSSGKSSGSVSKKSGRLNKKSQSSLQNSGKKKSNLGNKKSFGKLLIST